MDWATDLLKSPWLVFVCSFALMAIASWIGAFLGRRRKMGAETREDFGIIRTATLTLLGLIVGFTFSMALTRYDQRKNYEEAEANAIGTEYIRADLLPAVEAAKIRSLLLSYLEQRIMFYLVRDDQRLYDIGTQTAHLRAELWAAVRGPTLAEPSPVVALAVAGMNDVLNAQGYTQAAWRNRIPHGAWGLMLAIALCANALVAFGTRFTAVDLLIMPLVVAVALFLIADIDSPRGGDINVKPQNLQSLSESLRATESVRR